MNKIRKFGIITLALAALAAALPQAASATGSIRSITSYQTDNTGFRTYGPDDIVRIGEYIAFKVRLLNYNTNCTTTGGLYNPWVFRRNPIYDATMATNNMPKMGLWISGHKRYATLKSCTLDGYYTVLVLEYRAQAGDMGMPVKFCNRYGTNEILNSPDQQYLLENVGPGTYWDLVDATTGTRCEYMFGNQYLDPSGSTDNSEYAPPGWSSASEVFDYDLSQAQIYIRTVDFDEALSDAWRTVYENKSMQALYFALIGRKTAKWPFSPTAAKRFTMPLRQTSPRTRTIPSIPPIS